jgi:quercetin dioxygenase-like cupin family protein
MGVTTVTLLLFLLQYICCVIINNCWFGVFYNVSLNIHLKLKIMENKAFPTAEKFSMTDKVAYAEGSVVSKIIIRNERGNVTLFAFDKGEFLSEHTAPYDAIVQVLDGKAEIIIDGRTFELNVGESIIMPANVRHAVVAIEQFKMLLTMIK